MAKGKKGKKGKKSDEPVEEETDWDRMDIEMLKVSARHSSAGSNVT